MNRSLTIVAASLALVVCAACGGADADRPSSTPAVAVSLLGEPLPPPDLPADFRAEQEAKLAEARAALERDPDDPDALVWVGRRLGYLARYDEAIEVFTRGVERHPEDARFLRHRGHRFVTLRRLPEAIADLAEAEALVADRPDEVEPDGLPNARGIPTSTLKSNIRYHLGLAWYLSGDFRAAAAVYGRCLEVSSNPDMLVATTHWAWMTERRLGRDAEAAALLEPIHAGMDIIENEAYHRLLLLYRGEVAVDELLAGEAGEGAADATDSASPALLYGVANWLRETGDEERGRALLERIVAGEAWAAFGHIAAEADLARLTSSGRAAASSAGGA